MWGLVWANINRSGESSPIRTFPYPTRSFKHRYHFPYSLQRRMYYHGKLYSYLLRFWFELDPVFFFQLRQKVNLDNKKRIYTPRLLYIEPTKRDVITQDIFFYFLWFWSKNHQQTTHFRLSPRLIRLFWRYYQCVFKRVVLFYLVKD